MICFYGIRGCPTNPFSSLPSPHISGAAVRHLSAAPFTNCTAASEPQVRATQARYAHQPIAGISHNNRSGVSTHSNRDNRNADGTNDRLQNGSDNYRANENVLYRAAVGIDLGTTTSAIAVTGADGRPMVVEDAAGRAVIPSVVLVRQDGSVLVGDEAVAAAESDAANVYYGIKRLMGRTYGEALKEADEDEQQSLSVQERMYNNVTSHHNVTSQLPHQHSQLPQHQHLQKGRRLRSYALVEGAGGGVELVCPALRRNLTPVEISSYIVRHLVERARVFLERQHQEHQLTDVGECRQEDSVQVLDAVITVPAHYGPAARRAVVAAAQSAGLERVTLLQEPIAAALAYGFGSPTLPYDVLLVFDLGGGTLDLTIVEAFDGILEVLSTSGDNFLGGDDFTAVIADWLTQQQKHLVLQSAPQEQNHFEVQQQLQHPLETQRLLQPEAPSPGEIGPYSASSNSSAASNTYSSTAVNSQTPSPSAAAAADSQASKQDALTLLRIAEKAKLALSEAVAAFQSSRSTSSSCSASTRSADGIRSVSVRVRLPRSALNDPLSQERDSNDEPLVTSLNTTMQQQQQVQTDGTQPISGVAGDLEAELTYGTFEDLVRPLMQRLWWPLERVALATRTQLSGRLPPHLDPRVNAAAVTSSSVSREGPGRREGAAAWEFSIFPQSFQSSEDLQWAGTKGGGAKYVAPPRKLSGLVLVGAATRLPVIRDYITEVSGLPVRPGVDPEIAVALGAALHAGLMVGSVAAGIEMNDGGYVAAQHGRAGGFQVAMGVGQEEGEGELQLVWEP